MIIATFRDRPSPGSRSKASSSKGKQKQRNLSRNYDDDSDFDESEDEIEELDESQVGIDPSVIGWAYMGSHNFTPSAWGTLSGSSAKPVLNVRALIFSS